MSEDKEVKQCIQNMQNPDFLWEIPKDGTEQRIVQQVQESRTTGDNTTNNKDSEK